MYCTCSVYYDTLIGRRGRERREKRDREGREKREKEGEGEIDREEDSLHHQVPIQD